MGFGGGGRDIVMRDCTLRRNNWKVEISPGPGVVENNTCYGNTGSGLKLAESTHLTVRNNLLVGNGAGIEFHRTGGRSEMKCPR